MKPKSPEMKSMFGGQPSGGFFDLPLLNPDDTEQADIVLLGVPLATPYNSVGPYCADAPDAIRAAFGWPGVLNHHDFDIDGHLIPEGIKAVDWGVQFFPMREVVRNGIQAVIDTIPENANLYIALDIDVMDPAVVPSVIGPAPGGFSYWQMLEILEAVAARAKIVGFNLAELMPSADIGGRGALVAARIVAMVMGLVARQSKY